MNRFATKFAASAMVVAVAIAGCHSDSVIGTASAGTADRANNQAARLIEQARVAHARGDHAEALRLAERAVELAPRDSGYRMLLADVYLRGGRFQSAESTYGDVLALDPGNERAALSIALVRIGLGETGAALEQLEAIRDTATASDVGLAYALAGQPQRAIEILEPAARADGATGRTRQNLALAYAFAGDWQRARTVAAQDVSPGELGARLEQWAALTRPSAPGTAVASLLGVTPTQDSGQPTRLALAPQAAAQAYAAAAPVEAPIVEAEAPAPSVPLPAPRAIAFAETPVPVPVAVAAEPEVIRYAEAPSVPAAETANWWPSSAAVPVAAVPVAAEAPPAPSAAPAEVRYAAAARNFSAPNPALTQSPAAQVRAAAPAIRPRVQRASAIQLPRAGNGSFVVQLGSFANPANADRAWGLASSRFGLGDAQPHRATVTIGGRRFHRVAIGGFASRNEAARICGSIQARGGTCFVRATAGDTSVRWAGRSTRSNRG
jgi:Flp pilus assembly protein TadD